MKFYSNRGFRPYVPVAQRRIQVRKVAKELAGKGRVLSPVRIDGRTIAGTFWGQAWCRNLESYSDYANRLPRGRTYVRNGAVIDLQIAAGVITALVQGSALYTITIKIAPLAEQRWRAFKDHCAGRITNLLDLLQGRLSKEVLADLTARDTGLFPAPSEIDLGCSCPDWAKMCKHVAAVLYGVGARLDHEPSLFFTLRGVDMQELVSAASTAATADLAGAGSTTSALADAELADIFGVELEPTAAAPRPAVPNTTGTAQEPSRARSSVKTTATQNLKRNVAGKVKKIVTADGKRGPLGRAAAKKQTKGRSQARKKRSPSR